MIDAHHRAELMQILAEECAEVIQVISKINRFGFSARNPNDPTLNNKDRLTKEMGDLLCMINLAVRYNLIDPEELNQAVSDKTEKLKKWSSLPL